MYTSLTAGYRYRFGGLARLYGEAALPRLAQAHMVVVGLGGVGSWAAEALARSGIGNVTLIDLDDVCVSNSNRQVHALQSTVGRLKSQVMCQRLRDINPEINVHCIDDFLTAKNLSLHITARHHVVIDATDASTTKAALVAYCSALKIRLVTVGSSGGKKDPQKIMIADLGFTQNDPLLARVRHQLYSRHRFAREARRKFRVDAVFSTEPMVYPKPNGEVCHSKQFVQEGMKLDCASGFGSSVMVTGSFGFAAATRAVERHLQKTASADVE